jgi:hypothetical protein
MHCLWSNAGRVTTYKRLCSLIGHNGTDSRQLHILRQYMAWVSQTLAAHRVPYIVTTARGVGCALCEDRRKKNA